MLTKWLRKILPGKQPAAPSHKQVLPLAEHGITPDAISYAAEKVVSRLHQAGFEAYVVGGAVRDLLLGIEPKDYDVATNARPEQVRKVFRRSRIIGRRFQIVHVMVGPETIEVTTFRGGKRPARQNEHGRIMQDNSYGSMEQDAARRDFTCNALYYNPERQEITDFHHGVADIRAKRLMMIGDARSRYQEDPVRMLRAARLSGKLGFQVAPDTAAPIAECLHLLPKEPLARLFDEVMKLLFSGAAADCLKQMQALGMSGKTVHPLLACALERLPENQGRGIVSLALGSTDQRLRDDMGVSVGFVLAAVLWPQVRETWQRELANGRNSAHALSIAVGEMRAQMEKGWGVPHRFTASMREIWQLQPQFDHRRGARPFRLLAQPRFRAAYDFLLLRARAGEADQAVADWWTAFQEADEEQRKQMIQKAEQRPAAEGDAPAKKRRRRRKKKPAGEQAGAAQVAPQDGAAE
ncbi:polynucleotide adenylyltransferase PcnB [Eikenella sp. Marseille-P7795]|uniref:polynucleotide adenylyltransferase PcnB n=1 Tax=Eikenella sp. Marseille-P7795 TaxID=2866577 RepID=UPI001CE3DF20|nr:polynucleotide adenylyltransferase PcnB [Eikenella sp. Marseille-P7795]